MPHPHHFLHEYHPYWAEYKKLKNPNFDGISRQLLNFKDVTDPKHKAAVARFGGDVNTFMQRIAQVDRKYTLAVVPSHRQGITSDALVSVVQQVAGQRKNVAAMTDLIRRTKTIDKLSGGGDRSVAVHMGSMEVVSPERIKGAHVIVLDDISTTGNSLEATETLLMKQGAKTVTTVVIGKTVHV